jgi:predicted TIM-barrel fold metal-dependent hydrolase
MSAADSQRKIDVHAHYLPTGYADEMRKGGIVHPDGMPHYPDWSPELALETYEKYGIGTGMLSLSSPGVHYGDDAAARRIARKANDTGAELVTKYPSRFGLFASLPMPDIDGSLKELAHVFDELHADGVGLKTNAHGVYLGDKKFDPIFDELNRRKAVVFIHPTSPSCWQQCAMDYPRPMIEFPVETARAVTNLIFSGTLQRCPDITVIIPHNGGVLPILAERIDVFGKLVRLGSAGVTEARAAMQRLYYDTAMAASKHSLSSMLQLIDVSHVVYGSDWPWYPEKQGLTTNRELEETSFFTDQDRQAIYRDNASSFLPRVKALK